MLPRRLRALPPALILLLSGPVPAGPDLESCLGLSTSSERSVCLDSYLDGHPLTAADLDTLEQWVRQDPQEAGLLRRAMASHDGATPVAWFGKDGRNIWSVAIDTGDGRLERAARTLLAVGDKHGARSLLERALSLGAEGWVEEAWQKTGGGPLPGLDPEPSDLRAAPWFRRLPDLEVSLVGGDSFRLSATRGRVLILDFWATWCVPCMQELPRLQRLHRDLEGRGLVALTINAEEPDDLVRSFAEQIRLELPIGRYDEALREAFRVESLPTLILADREGRVRYRWSGYKEGLEDEVARRARALLDGNDPETAPRRVATVLAGHDLLRAEWVRHGAMSVKGVAVVTRGDGTARIAAASGGGLATLDRNGDLLTRIKAPPAAGLLKAADLDGDGSAELISFRPGGNQIVVVDLDEQDVSTWPAPQHVMGAWPIAAGALDAESGGVLLATLGGLYRSDPLGRDVRKFGATVEATSTAVLSAGDAPRVLALGPGGTLLEFDGAGRQTAARDVPDWSWSLLTPGRGAAGWGVLPSSVSDAVVGRFLPGEGLQAAVASRSSQLVLLDLEDGGVRFRARWPGISGLAAGDLDGDGRDELVVAAGPDFCLISASDSDPE